MKPFNYFFRFEVAIKEAIVQNARYELFEEAKAMIRVSKHDHIVNIQGICDGQLTAAATQHYQNTSLLSSVVLYHCLLF